MAVFRIEKTKDYTVMSNTHLREKGMSLKAKGLLSLMLALPEDWDYSLEGLAAICLENESAIRTALKELEEHGYLERVRNQNDKGQFEYDYNIYEKPHIEKPHTDNPHTVEPHTEAPHTENQGQLNTNKLNTDKQNTKELNTENNNSLFIKKIKEKKAEYINAGNGVKSFILATAWARQQPEYALLTNEERRKLILEV